MLTTGVNYLYNLYSENGRYDGVKCQFIRYTHLVTNTLRTVNFVSINCKTMTTRQKST